MPREEDSQGSVDCLGPRTRAGSDTSCPCSVLGGSFFFMTIVAIVTIV